MVYKFRDRKQKRIYLSSSSSESDSSYSDPDYSRTRLQRQPRRRNNNLNIAKQATDAVMAEGGVVTPTPGRRRGRPPKRKMCRGEKQSTQAGESSRRREQAPCSLEKRARCAEKARETERRRTILSWLIDLEIIEVNAEVWYMDDTRERILLKGRITRAGIFCHCCKKEITVWEFEVHAECDFKTPYANIFLAKKRASLLECQLEGCSRTPLSKDRGFNQIKIEKNATDRNDDACMICADGGDLICCEKCPSTFHADCMHMEGIPQDEWLCPYCVCKYCGDIGHSNVELFTCSHCRKKYHWACCLDGELDLNGPATPVISAANKTPVNSFCGPSCREIYEHLERIMGARNELDGGFSWSLIRQTDLQSAAPIDNLHHIVECNCKIAVVWGMIAEPFDAMIDRHTNVDVIQSVIYNRGSNFNRVNFEGFYTAILEKDDEVICAASLRIHGNKFAEMPFVATEEMYRHKGMWRKLLVEIESALSFLNVECLIIPSIEDLVPMWTTKYGFFELEGSWRRELTFYNTLMFTKAVRLQKSLQRRAEEPEAMEVDEAIDNNDPNREDPRQNRRNDMMQGDMEVDGIAQNGRNRPLLDLNVAPLEENDATNELPKILRLQL